MAAVLTVQHDADGEVTGYGSTCPEHPQFDRTDLAQQHAMNVVAKHNRESHAEPVLNLSAAARALVHAFNATCVWSPAAQQVWEALTGLPEAESHTYLAAILAEPEDVLVHVAPF